MRRQWTRLMGWSLFLAMFLLVSPRGFAQFHCLNQQDKEAFLEAVDDWRNAPRGPAKAEAQLHLSNLFCGMEDFTTGLKFLEHLSRMLDTQQFDHADLKVIRGQLQEKVLFRIGETNQKLATVSTRPKEKEAYQTAALNAWDAQLRRFRKPNKDKGTGNLAPSALEGKMRIHLAREDKALWLTTAGRLIDRFPESPEAARAAKLLIP